MTLLKASDSESTCLSYAIPPAKSISSKAAKYKTTTCSRFSQQVKHTMNCHASGDLLKSYRLSCIFTSQKRRGKTEQHMHAIAHYYINNRPKGAVPALPRVTKGKNPAKIPDQALVHL